MANLTGTNPRPLRMMNATMLSLILLLFILVSLILSYAVLMGLFRENRQYRVLHEQLQRQHDSLEAEKVRLDDSIKKIGTDSYVIEVAREELGMVSSDEVVFVDGNAK